jgi:arylsulfatase A-like enzyme
MGRQYLNSYSPQGGWYVMGVPPPYSVGIPSGTNHISPYTYDTHVPLALYGLAFQPGTYRRHAEPVDLTVTLASLLGINAPTHATGRVLAEALSTRPDNESRPPSSQRPSHGQKPAPETQPASLALERGTQ